MEHQKAGKVDLATSFFIFFGGTVHSYLYLVWSAIRN
jgi:hypothetical protein